MFGKMFWSVVGTACIVGPGAALPPPNPDPRLRAWFESLIDQESMLPCCGEADCRAVEARVAVDHHEAFVRGAWLRIPVEKVVHRTDNPTGGAILCWSPALGVLCFVPGPGV